MSEFATIPSYLIADSAYIICPYCRNIHRHGTAKGSRAVHCDPRKDVPHTYFLEEPRVVSVQMSKPLYDEYWGRGSWDKMFGCSKTSKSGVK